MKKIAFFGGSFNPPTKAHFAIVDYLMQREDIDLLIVKPCGLREDKPELSNKREGSILKFLELDQKKLLVDLSDLQKPILPTIDEVKALRIKYNTDDVWIVVGTDLFLVEPWGGTQIQRWSQGEKLFSEGKFYIFPRPNFENLSLPKHHILADDFKPLNISSTMIRQGQANPTKA